MIIHPGSWGNYAVGVVGKNACLVWWMEEVGIGRLCIIELEILNKVDSECRKSRAQGHNYCNVGCKNGVRALGPFLHKTHN